MSIFTTYVLADPSLIEGLGRLLDLGGTMIDYNYAPVSHEQAVGIALTADALAVAADFRSALADSLDELAGRLEASLLTAA